MHFPGLLTALVILVPFANLSNPASAQGSLDWSSVTLSGAYPTYTFTHPDLGAVVLSYSNSERSGITTYWASTETLILGNSGDETLTMSWASPISSLDIPIWDIDSLGSSSHEKVVFSTTATISMLSLHSSDVWQPAVPALESDNQTNAQGDTGNYSILRFTNSAGFSSIQFTWTVAGGHTGSMGIGDLSEIAVGSVAAGSPYCFGHPGSGSPCPCSNDNDGTLPGAGCGNGAFPSGARLGGSGMASVSSDSLVLTTTGLHQNNTGLYFQANNAVNGGDGNTFGDGLRCAGGGLIRLEVRISNGSGVSSSTIAIGGKGGVSPGDTKRYQCWYRDTSGNQPCGVGVNDFNLSNGYEVTWLP